MDPRSASAFMRRALRLASRARHLTSPNPAVGAVVVRDGVVVGEGYHRGPGTAHAEVVALEAAGEAARGATMIVTLAPCTKQGRTPPCAPALIEAGIAEVSIGSVDPNPAEDPGSIEALRAAGIEVTAGVRAEEADELIENFAVWITRGRPMVTAKVASTIDGRVAAGDGSSRWITGQQARRDAHRLRAAADAILVGVGTIIADDPALTVRARGYDGAQPLRVVLDSSGRTPSTSKVLDGSAPALVATTDKAIDDAVEQIRATGADVLRFPSKEGRVDIEAVIASLGSRGVTDLLVEGGPAVTGELLERRLADRCVFYVAPALLGQLGTPSVAGLVAPTIADARRMRITAVRRLGEDVRIDLRPGD